MEQVDEKLPEGDGSRQYCPRCGGFQKVFGKGQAACRSCSWKISWVGPLFGEAVR